MSTVDDVEEKLRDGASTARPASLALDLRKVTFLDSSGLRLVLRLDQERAKQADAWSWSGAPRRVARVFELTRADERARDRRRSVRDLLARAVGTRARCAPRGAPHPSSESRSTLTPSARRSTTGPTTGTSEAGHDGVGAALLEGADAELEGSVAPVDRDPRPVANEMPQGVPRHELGDQQRLDDPVAGHVGLRRDHGHQAAQDALGRLHPGAAPSTVSRSLRPIGKSISTSVPSPPRISMRLAMPSIIDRPKPRPSPPLAHLGGMPTPLSDTARADRSRAG